MSSRFRTFNGTKRNTFGKKRYSGYRNFAKQSSSLDISLLVKKASESLEVNEFEIINSFNNFKVTQELKNNISAKGYSIPTPIQDRAIPILLEGKDVVGIANTGTGKTAAFLIPILEKIHNNRANKALIVAPTRELASQIYEECRSFTKNLGIQAALCIGGVGLYGQKKALRNNPNIVIGTPGRLKDLNNQRSLNFSNYNLIVLDEVDRMLDMGFIHDVKFIISCLPQERQSMFFSATITREIEGIMHSFLNDPVTISVKVGTSSQNVDQDVVSTYGKVKIEVLHDLLIKDGFDKVLVFAKTKRGIEKLADQLKERGFKVVSLHGNKSQNQRQSALEKFKENQVRILLATDIAARGLDIDDITHVINYDLPQTYEDYVHRIGRTGRANKKGSALSFVD